MEHPPSYMGDVWSSRVYNRWVEPVDRSPVAGSFAATVDSVGRRWWVTTVRAP